MYIKITFFHHFKWLSKAVQKLNGEAFANVNTMVVEIRLDNRVYVLHPMFTATHEGKKVYTYQFSPDVTNFAGWKPYVDRPVPELGKKLTFKKFVENNGLNTPAYSLTADTGLKDVIVKKDISSFGDQIYGPFEDTSHYQLNSEAGEYFECFTPGNIIKIWYWNDKPVVMESKDMPTVTGDGVATAKDLIKSYHGRLKKSFGEINWKQVASLLEYQGLKPDDVVPTGSSIYIDFRYISAFMEQEDARSTQFESPDPQFGSLYKLGSHINTELESIGQKNTLYSVDAIRGEDGRFWFLEVNFNPAIHPCLYPDMVNSLKESDHYRELRRVAQ